MKKYITAKEAATITDLATNTLTLAAQNGEISGYKERGKWLLLSTDIVRLNKTPHKKGVKRNKVEIKPIQSDKQLSIFDYEVEQSALDRPVRINKASGWQELPRFTFMDLLEQYKRGIEEGKRIARGEE